LADEFIHHTTTNPSSAAISSKSVTIMVSC
jgi:hypothetical protein